ncbi:MAG: hypothetical protein NQU46_03965 [Methanolinea sp.]|nr:hypothetical protein [Methanolinea sp.]
MSANPSGRKGKNPEKKTFMERYRENLEREKAARERERQQKLRSVGRGEEEQETAEEPEETPEVTEKPRKKTREEKQAEHLGKIKKTLVACIIGILTGIISFLLIDPTHVTGLQSYTILAFLIMVAGVVVQRHLFVLLGLGTPSMGAKDWLYQGFITFALWFITWTILLTQGV